MKYNVSFDLELRKNSYPGKFLAIEGIDGSGKTTQAHSIVERFKKNNVETIYTKEPTDGTIGKLIRQVIKGETDVPPVSFQYLFAVDRQMHQQEIVQHLKKGAIVVSDRCFWSAVPYGMVDREGVDGDSDVLLVAQSILSMYHQFIVPDVTFHLEIPVDAAMGRLSKMTKAQELYEKREKLEKIVKGYEWLVRKFPEVITVVDGEMPVGKVTEEIISQINKYVNTTNNPINKE